MNNIFLIIHKIKIDVKENGIVFLINKLFSKFWKEFTKGRQYLFSIDCDHIFPEKIKMTNSVGIESFRSKDEISPKCLEDLKQFVKKKHMDEKTCNHYLDKLLEIFKIGGEITVGKIDGKIVGFLWKIHSYNNYQQHFELFPLLPQDGLVFAGHALPSYRGKGIIPTLIQYNSVLLKQEGAKRIFATCKEWNQSSRRCILKAGLNQIALGRSIHFFGKRIVVWY